MSSRIPQLLNEAFSLKESKVKQVKINNLKVFMLSYVVHNMCIGSVTFLLLSLDFFEPA